MREREREREKRKEKRERTRETGNAPPGIMGRKWLV